jgi:hypothetical protein
MKRGKGKKNSCFDCLHCKVSAKSTRNCKLYFCAKTKKKANHKEPFWTKRKVCRKFDDMSA